MLSGAQCRALQPRQPGNKAYLGAYSSADIPTDPLEAGMGDASRCMASIEQEVANPERIITLHRCKLASPSGVILRHRHDSVSLLCPAA